MTFQFREDRDRCRGTLISIAQCAQCATPWSRENHLCKHRAGARDASGSRDGITVISPLLFGVANRKINPHWRGIVAHGSTPSRPSCIIYVRACVGASHSLEYRATSSLHINSFLTCLCVCVWRRSVFGIWFWTWLLICEKKIYILKKRLKIFIVIEIGKSMRFWFRNVRESTSAFLFISKHVFNDVLK